MKNEWIQPFISSDKRNYLQKWKMVRLKWFGFFGVYNVQKMSEREHS